MEETKIEEKKIIVNGKSFTETEFAEEKKKLTEKKIKLVEVGNNEYKTRLED